MAEAPKIILTTRCSVPSSMSLTSLQTEEALTVKEYKHTHTHTHAHMHARRIIFFRRATFFRKAIFRITYFFSRATISERLLFQKTSSSIEVTFSVELLFHFILVQKSYYFTATLPFQICTFYLFLFLYLI